MLPNEVKMNAAIITIGDEILIGQILDTNSAWIAEQLSLLGIEVVEIRSISDKNEVIIQSLKHFEGQVDLAIFTGGLGPTRDDITKNAFNEYFGGKLRENPDVIANIERLFKLRSFKLSPVNSLQATVPDNCIILKNAEGTAPGMVFERSNTLFVSLPGVPYEMKSIILNEFIPFIAERRNGKIIVHRTVMTQGVPESYLAERIEKWENSLPANFGLAYLPHPGIVRLRLTAIGEQEGLLKELLQVEIDKLIKIIGKDIFATEDISLEKVVGNLLVSRKEHLSLAESCTGGHIAHLITSVPGSSAFFKAGIIAYSNIVKVNDLGVDVGLIDTVGAVSREVVEQMAEKAREKFDTEYAISTSGIAGPLGGTKEKPVGLTWIAVASSKKCVSKSFMFGEHRGRNIEKASYTALNMLKNMILEIE